MDGILRCTRYGFGPNRLHYCGPDANSEIKAYLENNAKDPGLTALLKNFETMYPYLRHIAQVNNIKDPFDEKVVEAYWIGNELLDNIGKKEFYHHLIDNLHLKKKIGTKSFDIVTDKIQQGAVPHHSFHVLDVWKRTGHLERDHTLESMDECRIGWGKVVEVSGPKIVVETEPLIYLNTKLQLGKKIKKTVTRKLESEHDIEQLKPGEIITIHWSVPCEVITQKQADTLKKYTIRHIALANLTI
ncbi:MAG: hypothetical protein US74_C0048G0006 [Parcubacteria group bacterium GW2011_GWA2_38_13]|nr:MAG: hypothetical protein US74_C0048G0006 [Parcubacteria group bacterium GW2011_GWA2_38_13]